MFLLTTSLTIFSIGSLVSCLPSSLSSSLPETSARALDDAFESFRQLIHDSSESTNSVQHYSPLGSLDPLELPRPIVNECRDKANPSLGKTVLTLNGVRFTGLSSFRVENVDNSGSCLTFQHTIPQLDACANYTVDYYLFDAIPLRIQEGSLKATIPKARIVGRFASAFPTKGINDPSSLSNFNLETKLEEQIALAVYPKSSISDRFVVARSMDRFDSALRSGLPQVSEILQNAYNRIFSVIRQTD